MFIFRFDCIKLINNIDKDEPRNLHRNPGKLRQRFILPILSKFLKNWLINDLNFGFISDTFLCHNSGCGRNPRLSYRQGLSAANQRNRIPR